MPVVAESRDRSFGATAGYGADGLELEFDVKQGQENFRLSTDSRPALGFTQEGGRDGASEQVSK
jgi:hypothetical protein